VKARGGPVAPRAWLALALLAGNVLPAFAWLTEGHRRIGVAAVEAAAPALPPFFVAGAATVGHVAVDPDIWKNAGTPELRAGEEPSHYLDSEALPPGELPRTRVEFLAWLAASGRSLPEAGSLPYSVIEGTERLALCFAEHRLWPENPHVRTKCLVYAGWLAHYAADLAQPLHTTIHHDGWALPNGTSPLVGFHKRIDALVERAPIDVDGALAGLTAEPFDDLRVAVLAELAASRALVDRTYRLEPLLSGPKPDWAHPEVAAFACDRYRESVGFLARLLVTAWESSKSLKVLPDVLRESGALERPRSDR